MPVEYVPVAEEEGEEAIEVPTEENGNLLLSTLSSQFPGIMGLKYRNPETHTFRALRLADGVLHKPPELDSWAHSNIVYVCNFPKDNKRKGDDVLENPSFKAKKPDRKKCCDLIVLGLPYKCVENDLKAYFSKFGELVMTQVKRDFRGESRGYGFVRFSEYESQLACVQIPRHHIEGRWCEVKVPISQGESTVDNVLSRKVFVGRVTEELTAEVLKEFFGEYGSVTEVFIPKPFRAFAFVTFADAESAESVVGEDFIVDGVSVHVSAANPKLQQQMRGSGPPNSNQASMGMSSPGMSPNPQNHLTSGPQTPSSQTGMNMHRRQGWTPPNPPTDPYTAAMVNSIVNNPSVLAAALAQVSNMSVNGGEHNHRSPNPNNRGFPRGGSGDGNSNYTNTSWNNSNWN